MSSKKEDRNKHALCGAKTRGGRTCRLYAGHGTPHPGVGRCKYHGGCVPNQIKHAVKLEAQRRAIEFGEKLEVDPTTALMTVLHLSAGHLEFLRTEIAGHAEQSSFERQVLLQMWNDERDRVARISKAALDSGLPERQVKLAERYGELLAGLLRGVFDDPELGMTPEQRGALPTVLRRHLVAVDGGGSRARTRAGTQPALAAAS